MGLIIVNALSERLICSGVDEAMHFWRYRISKLIAERVYVAVFIYHRWRVEARNLDLETTHCCCKKRDAKAAGTRIL